MRILSDARPKFSVITVTFNNASGLSKTLETVLQQTYDNFEWIVVDGKSTDGTVALLEQLDNKRFKFISEQDRGIFDAMNKGIKMSSGDYCIFMNAGDCFFDECVLENVSDLIKDRRPTIVYGDACETDGQQRWQKPARAPKANFYVMFTHHQAIFYLRSALGRGYDLSYRFSSDWALTTRMLNDPNVTTLQYPANVCLFERGGVSQGDIHRRQINAEHWRIYIEESKMNRAVAAVLWVAKVGTNSVRRIFPNLYDALRYS
ncbi:glycosyltransferase [Bradyrhizobium sp. IC3123]|uniref:glycosyltransferase family 2 protein n=1 Tax=unclassified Bradyrhizobium TaxID=2631580 RepID=UPI001CD28AAD|nr:MULTISPECIES: glycosyltransferase family 2 protein [unclassified Bradyrhizobium]MCA1392266.1 glycosyltransferase [Bradyrhizobium sp. IC3123]